MTAPNPEKKRELELIQSLQQQQTAWLSTRPDWAAHAPVVERLAALDVPALAAAMVPQLELAFTYWNDPKKTGNKKRTPLAGVSFEWPHDHFHAAAAGFATCTPRAPEQLQAVALEACELERCVFDDCGEVRVHEVMSVTFPDRATGFVDLQTFKVAEVMHHALATAVKSDAFAALPKAPTLRFFAGQHNRFPVLVLVWEWTG